MIYSIHLNKITTLNNLKSNALEKKEEIKSIYWMTFIKVLLLLNKNCSLN